MRPIMPPDETDVQRPLVRRVNQFPAELEGYRP